LIKESKYPRVLVVALGRINADDSYNNGLLLRNLFSYWPRENIAQIYSSGDNGDKGYFGSYYKIGAADRIIGSFFYNLKTNTETSSSRDVIPDHKQTVDIGFKRQIKYIAKRFFIDTGLYELIFRPKISYQMSSWIETFKPDIILAQGYNLTFAWLPLILKQKFGFKLSFLTTDDWPTYLYSGQLGEPTLFSWFVRPIVKNLVNRLFSEVDVPFAFGQPMSEEYALRYGKKFVTLNHVDSPLRFESAEPCRVYPPDVVTIVAIGNYNCYRWPLLLDVNDACEFLHIRGINVRLVVLSSFIEPEGFKALSLAPYIDVLPDPGHELLPSYLKGADILFLAEGFDEGFVSAIKLSVSSKAHLFMFSKRPIIVYSHPETGIALYARLSGWAKLVTRRNIGELAEAIQHLIENKKEKKILVTKAYEIALKNHTSDVNCKKLLEGLSFSSACCEHFA
jgi:glycosyltransferase involved in cell wall biosynthesis